MADKEVKGVNVGLYVDISGTYTLVAAKRGLEFEENTDTIDIGHSDNYGWIERLPGQQEATVDWDGLVLLDDATGNFAASHQALRQTKRQGNILALEIRYPFGGSVDQGSGIITSLNISAPYDGETTFSASIESTGAFSFA